MDTVAARLCANINDRVSSTACFAVEDFVFADQAEREGVYQRVAVVTSLKFGFAAQVWHAKAVSVTGDAADHTFNNGVIAIDEFFIGAARLNRAKTQRVHHGQRPCAHGENIAQNSANASRGALERFNIAGVVVAFNLEGAGPTVSYVDNAGILTWPLHHAVALGG